MENFSTSNPFFMGKKPSLNTANNAEALITQFASGGWIKHAVNPKHKGYCTPMSKSTCTPHRKALALTFKKHHGFHEDGGEVLPKYGFGGGGGGGFMSMFGGGGSGGESGGGMSGGGIMSMIQNIMGMFGGSGGSGGEGGGGMMSMFGGGGGGMKNGGRIRRYDGGGQIDLAQQGGGFDYGNWGDNGAATDETLQTPQLDISDYSTHYDDQVANNPEQSQIPTQGQDTKKKEDSAPTGLNDYAKLDPYLNKTTDEFFNTGFKNGTKSQIAKRAYNTSGEGLKQFAYYGKKAGESFAKGDYIGGALYSAKSAFGVGKFIPGLIGGIRTSKRAMIDEQVDAQKANQPQTNYNPYQMYETGGFDGSAGEGRNQAFYADGGEVDMNDNKAPYSQANVEAEGGEFVNTGEHAGTIDGDSHEEGGEPMNLPVGSQIFSDRLKTKVNNNRKMKSYADIAKKYNTEEEMETLKTDKGDKITEATAKYNIMFKQKKLEELFAVQEANKESGAHGKKVQMDALVAKFCSGGMVGKYAGGGRTYNGSVAGRKMRFNPGVDNTANSSYNIDDNKPYQDNNPDNLIDGPSTNSKVDNNTPADITYPNTPTTDSNGNYAFTGDNDLSDEDIKGKYPQYFQKTPDNLQNFMLQNIKSGRVTGVVPTWKVDPNNNFGQGKNTNGLYGGAKSYGLDEFKQRVGPGFFNDIETKLGHKFDPKNTGDVKQFQEKYNDFWKDEFGTEAPPYFDGSSTSPFGYDDKLGNWTVSVPIINRKTIYTGNKNGVSDVKDPNAPTDYYSQFVKGTSTTKATTEAEDKFNPKPLDLKPTDRDKPYQEGLDPSQLAGEAFNLVQGKKRVLFFEDRGPSDALSQYQRGKYLDIQPQLNESNAAMRAVINSRTSNSQVKNAEDAGSFAQKLGSDERAFTDKKNYDNQVDMRDNEAVSRLLLARGNSRYNAINSFEDKVNTRDAIFDETMRRTLESIGNKYAKNKLENRQSVLAQQLFPDYNYDPETGVFKSKTTNHKFAVSNGKIVDLEGKADEDESKYKNKTVKKYKDDSGKEISETTFSKKYGGRVIKFKK